MSDTNPNEYPCRLYLISPPTVELAQFSTDLDAALGAGDVGAFQLRLKDASHDEIVSTAKALLPICRKYNVAFIINDDVDAVLEVGADGVHLGQEDMPIKQARAMLGDDKVIGISCHDSSHMAMEAGDNGADYVAFGAFYPTKSKPPEKLAKYGTPTPDTLIWWSTYTVVPSVAIGGMSPQNCGPLVEAGADFIAVITGIWEAENGPASAVHAFNDAIKIGLHRRKEAFVAAE